MDLRAESAFSGRAPGAINEGRSTFRKRIARSPKSANPLRTKLCPIRRSLCKMEYFRTPPCEVRQASESWHAENPLQAHPFRVITRALKWPYICIPRDRKQPGLLR